FLHRTWSRTSPHPPFFTCALCSAASAPLSTRDGGKRPSLAARRASSTFRGGGTCRLDFWTADVYKPARRPPTRGGGALRRDALKGTLRDHHVTAREVTGAGFLFSPPNNNNNNNKAPQQ
uniref:Uncharacterized protein n=1 Tax=Gasterosteus aculeatus TaxID=69293 RepID=G3NKA9_GASAC